MSSSHLRVITTPLRLGARLSPVVVHKANAEECDTSLSKNKTFRGKRLQFPSPSPAASSSRLSPRDATFTITKYENLASTSAEILQAHVIPSVSPPDREHFFKHDFENVKRWNVLGRGTFGMVIEAKYKVSSWR